MCNVLREVVMLQFKVTPSKIKAMENYINLI